MGPLPAQSAIWISAFLIIVKLEFLVSKIAFDAVPGRFATTGMSKETVRTIWGLHTFIVRTELGQV